MTKTPKRQADRRLREETPARTPGGQQPSDTLEKPPAVGARVGTAAWLRVSTLTLRQAVLGTCTP